MDQGFEHGPARSFAANPAGYDPRYHARLALDAGCSAHVAPPGALELVAPAYADELPLILKCNSSDSLFTGAGPGAGGDRGCRRRPAAALRRGGFHDLPRLRGEERDVRRCGHWSATPAPRACRWCVWSYPRGSGLVQEGRTAVDVVAYAAHLACQLGAHVVKVKPPSELVENASARSALDKAGVPLGTLADRVRHVVQSAFDGHRVVIFSGGPAKETAAVLEENAQTARGGGFGTIMGRNSFQRPHDEAVALLHQVMDIHVSTSADVEGSDR